MQCLIPEDGSELGGGPAGGILAEVAREQGVELLLQQGELLVRHAGESILARGAVFAQDRVRLVD